MLVGLTSSEEIGARASNLPTRPRIVRFLASSDDLKDLQDLVNEINISIQDSIVVRVRRSHFVAVR